MNAKELAKSEPTAKEAGTESAGSEASKGSKMEPPTNGTDEDEWVPRAGKADHTEDTDGKLEPRADQKETGSG